jgi:hypothetical protein
MDKLNEKVAPFLTPFALLLFSAHIVPPWASTMFFDMYKPSPIPMSDFVANFVNNFDNISGSIPVPVSIILITTKSLLSFSLLLFSAVT